MFNHFERPGSATHKRRHRMDMPCRLVGWTRRWLVAICLLTVSHAALAEPATATSPLRFARLSTQSVDDKPIAVMLQDRQSFVWIGAIGGLYRYDGYSTVKYAFDANNKSSLPSNRVASMFEDKQ